MVSYYQIINANNQADLSLNMKAHFVPMLLFFGTPIIEQNE